jgi:uncharacterized protein DUF4154
VKDLFQTQGCVPACESARRAQNEARNGWGRASPYGKPFRLGVRKWLFSSAIALGLAAQFLSAGRAICADTSRTEYQLKAAYLLNFLKFVEWPTDGPAAPQGKWVIGFVGDSPVGAELALMAEGKTVEGRGLLVKRLHPKDNPRECDIIFVSASEEKHLAAILMGLQGSSVLTVADFDKFIERGGMIQFVTDGERIRMDVNLGATGRARLKVSSKLLALAQAVTETVRTANH